MAKQLLNLLPLYISLDRRGAYTSGCFPANQPLGMLRALLHPGLRSRRTININGKQTQERCSQPFCWPLAGGSLCLPTQLQTQPGWSTSTCLQHCPGVSDSLPALDTFLSTPKSFQRLIWSEISALTCRLPKNSCLKAARCIYLSARTAQAEQERQQWKATKKPKTNQTNIKLTQNKPKPIQSWQCIEKGQ